jgi:hypothetical protein
MKAALKANPRRTQVSVGRSIPAPTGGWNASVALANMKPSDAVILDNWIPRATMVELRRGSRLWTSGADDPVESLMAWRGPTAEELFAASGDSIYDVSTLGGTFTSPVVTGLTSAKFQSINFSNDGGNWLLAVNGADTPRRYDGSTWGTLTITGSVGSIVLDPADIIDIAGHKERLFLAEKDSLRVWFLETSAIQGTAQLLDLGPFVNLGGSLQCIATWSLDGGQGQDDYFVAMTNQGEVLIFQGDDPANVLYWTLVGVFQVGLPLGRRAMFKFGADLNVLTTNGVIPLSQALNLDRAKQNTVSITAKIQNAFSVSAQNYFDFFGWEGITYQRGNLAIYNVPTSELDTAEQYVQNLQTGAWCRFTGMNAICWAIYDEWAFFGSADGVHRFDEGVSDNGETIISDVKSAFNHFGDPSRLKQFSMLRPILNATANVRPAVEMLVDFQERAPIAVPTTIMNPDAGLSIRDSWTSVTGIGYWGAPRVRVAVRGEDDELADLAVGGGDLLDDGEGDTILTSTGDPVDAQIQLLGFNVLMQAGGQL